MPQWFGGSHFLGTDNLGRDITSRLLFGARVSLIIAFTVVIISGFIGISLGAISGYFGDKVDFIIQKFVEVVWAFPALLLAIAILAYLGQGLQNLILALVAQRWIQYCRIVRGETLSLFLDEEPTFAYLPPVYYYQGRVREALKADGFANSFRVYLGIRGSSTEDPLLPHLRRLGALR